MNFKSEINGILLFLLLIAFWNSDIISQSISFEHLTVKDGLAHNSGLYLVQDREGFLWIGTKHNGLNRFDNSCSDGIAGFDDYYEITLLYYSLR